MAMKLARIILHSDKFDMPSASKKGPKFLKHIQRSYSNNLEEFYSRLNGVLDFCVSRNIDVVVMPACAIPWKSPADLEQFRDKAKSFKTVITGCLRINGKKLLEHSEIWGFGKNLKVFDSSVPIAFRLNGESAVAAQSSTIRKVYRKPWTVAGAEENPPPFKFAIDLGHGQYGGRYTMVLGAIWKRHQGFVVLSFWRPKGSLSRAVWHCGGPPFVRYKTDFEDYVDVFSFPKNAKVN